MSSQGKERPYQINSVRINEKQLLTIQQRVVFAKIDRIKKTLQETILNLVELKDKRFIKMKNVPVWFDREVAGLYPRLEKIELPYAYSSNSFLNSFNKIIEGMECGDNGTFKKLSISNIDFYIPSVAEGIKTFSIYDNHPYVLADGTIIHCNYNSYCFVTDDYKGGSYLKYHNTKGAIMESSCNYIIIIPIHRFKGVNANPMCFPEEIHSFLETGLVPEGLNQKAEEQYNNLKEEYSDLKDYIIWVDNGVDIEESKLAEDMLKGIFNKSVFGCNCNLKELFLPEKHELLITDKDFPSALKTQFLESDYIRACLAPYPEKRITDINLGHWELNESDGDSFELPDAQLWTARPPQLDIVKDGVCAIDFGTKSTVVVCQNREAVLLRVGKGDYLEKPVELDYENPTAVCFRDIKSFIDAYKQREGRPFTKWEDLTVSHVAENVLFSQDIDSNAYYSVFKELKQWANDKNSQLIIKDLKGHSEVLKPYLEGNLDEGNIDPIEIYAYYLGLYINNMYNGIYLDYILSFPVNYAKDIRERIVKSFEVGIRKSLPQSILQDSEIMQWFRVYAGVSEPAAYAVSALQKFDLEPKDITTGTAYGVFDFGGGTTDFDFGIEKRSENLRKFKYEIEQFGSGGDVLLGGENILNLLAFEVYKRNLDIMREQYITIVLPPECNKEAGTEMLILEPKEASQYAYMNLKCIAEKMRALWEEKEECSYDEPLQVVLFSSNVLGDSKNKVSVELKIDKEKLEEIIKKRIESGVNNFFEALFEAFRERSGFGETIHIFLAGNSSKSHFVKELFTLKIDNIKKTIEEEKKKNADKLFEIHMPLGFDDSSSENIPTVPLNKKVTGKTGVAFGLLRCRKGGKEVRVVNKNVDSKTKELIFPYFIGDIDEHSKFHVRIGKQVDYNVWAPYCYADEEDFEIFYTALPAAVENKLSRENVKLKKCRIGIDEVKDDDSVMIYICKIKPDTIQYAVGKQKKSEKDNEENSFEISEKRYTVFLD